MGIDPPFLYDSPSKFSFTGPTDRAFNPRASTQASWQPPRPKAKPDGPLIDARGFNRHPDSYFVVPYGNLNWKPMSPNTKAKVKYVRWVQLFFRICALIGAIGMLFCVICIKGTQGMEGWIIRVPPGVAILHTIYAVYHLARSAKGRTPKSSASYMIFAAILDAGLIPFFVFTAIMSRTQYTGSNDSPGKWQTLFDSDGATYKITFATFIVSVINGNFHLISLVISLYLAIIFRQISHLPPDMNPLEDNLTSRHKRNKSSLVDNRMSQNTTNTTVRNSKAEEALISPPRTVPFLHTRADSLTNLANIPHPHTSPRNSRLDRASAFNDQPISKQSSRANIGTSLSPTRPVSSIYTDISRPNSTRPLSTNRSRSTAPSDPDENENWTTHPSPPPSPFEFKHLRNTPYQPLPQSLPLNTVETFPPRPLEMNPPTPPNHNTPRRGAGQNFRVLLPGTGNVVGFGGARRQRGEYEGLTGGKVRSGERVVTGGGRVVSRSGVEVGTVESVGRAFRAREVSGNVAEEGRGNVRWSERDGRMI